MSKGLSLVRDDWPNFAKSIASAAHNNGEPNNSNLAMVIKKRKLRLHRTTKMTKNKIDVFGADAGYLCTL